MCGASPAALGASLARAAPQNGPGARRASTAGLDGSGPSAALDTVMNTSRGATPSREARMARVLGTSPLYARSPSSKGERTSQVRPRAAMSTADPAATILLVEDDAPTRTFLADNLTADGYELLVADCARDGLRLLETKFPDVALVDLGLPDGSGLEIVRRVRASDGVASRIDPAVPLVVLSGRAGELDRLRGFERGCDDYVCKPFSYPELRARVEALLRRADVRRRPGRLRVGELEGDAGGGGGGGGRGSPRWGASCACAARRSSSPRRSSRSCARWPPIRRACSPRTSCYARSGAFAPWEARGRWTRTRAGCATSSAGPATASWSTCGARVLGSWMGRRSTSGGPSRRPRWRRPPPSRRCPCWRS